MEPTVIIGDSNIICLQKSVQISPEDRPIQMHYVVAWIVKEFVLELADGGVVINPLIRIPLAASGLYASTDVPVSFSGNLVLMLGSSLCNNIGLLAELKQFKFCLADENSASPAESPNERPVFSSALSRDVAAEQCDPLGRGLKMMSAMWPHAKIYLLAGPPPFADDSKTKAAIGLPIIPDPTVRLHLYNANMRILRSMAEAAGAKYVGVPTHLTDPAGFLREEYNEDGFHGNADYGSEILAHLKMALNESHAE